MEGYKYVNHPTKTNIIMPQVPRNSAEEPYSSDGLIPRCIRELFQIVEQKKEKMSNKSKLSVTCQYIQLYNEKVYDLLNSDQYKIVNNKRVLEGVPGLKIKVGNLGTDITIENVYQFECHNVQDGFKYFWKGLKNKMMASHKINNSSSRSHCILSFTITQVELQNPDNVIISKLQLVDLAGSERQSHVAAKGEERDPAQLKEAIEINKSLFTLRQVITALTENSRQSQSP